ncbi:MAG TPA: hypothetical protein ENG95_05900 [Nitrospirae bacterium]|nr:hypothetical protein [Nitrospirota bacterium]
MEYIFYADPGHSWLKVPMSEIKELGIEGKITPYSYINGGMVYLEEDCDAQLFIDKLKAEGKKFNYREVYTEHSPIRGYRSYQGPKNKG